MRGWSPRQADRLDATLSMRMPARTAGATVGGQLRAELIALAAAVEERCPSLHAELWLLGTDEERYVVHDAPARLRSHPCCSTAIRSATGVLLGAVVTFAREQRGPSRAEQESIESVTWMARLMIENARASEYRALLEQVPAVIYIADPGEDGRWHYVSPQLETVLGFTPEEWRADPLLWQRQLHPSDRDEVLADEESSEGTDCDPRATEYRMLHRDGRTVWIRDDALLVPDELGRRRWHGVLSDITDGKLAEAELERRAAQQAAVARLGEHALERLPVADLMQEAVSAAAEVLEVEITLVAELLADENALQLRASVGRSDAAPFERAPAGTRSQAGYALLLGAPVVVTDWATESRFEQSAPLHRAGVRSGVTVLIEGRDGPFGTFGAHSLRPREYSTGDVDFVQSLANVLADALERQTTEDAIEHRALHDPLTGLPNRVLFLDRLEHALERLRRQPRSQAAVLFIDLDHFKLVNDSLGHHAGDELLAAVATRLKQAVRPSDTVARFGGDEFGLLLEEVSSEIDAINTAERIAAVFARPFVLDANEHFVTTSVGIALAAGGELPDELIRDADAAMYRAKERGRARYELFDEVMRGRAIARLRIENDLRRAIERDQLRLVYQPIVSLRDESIVGVEALIRWNHPQRGLIPPSEFIPVAEENGLIERIGRWVLEGACRQAVHWAAARPDAAPVAMAVNLSPLQLSNRQFPETLSEVLQSSGIDPAWLSLEITETLLLDEADTIIDTLRAVKALGVRLVLDDFGTGYSSLSYLTRLPLDALKVDRSFVRSLAETSDNAITQAIIAMARALSLDVVGEGAETEAQVAELRALGCDLAQGYLFSAAVAPEEITAILQAGGITRAPRPRVES
jgi:diguanylate cyclase (GGDEF)-like protein/PAS domain S-box-containing protein